MKLWKKLLTLSMTCVLSVSLLVGCSGTTTPSSAAPTGTDSGNEAAAGEKIGRAHV